MKHKFSPNPGRFYYSSVRGNLGLSGKEVVSEVQWDGKLHFGRLIKTR